MGLWHGNTKQQIIDSIWDKEYYESLNELAKEYYTQEIQAFADYLNADSEEEYRASCAKYFTAMMRKGFAEGGLYSKEEIEELTIGPDAAVKSIKGKFEIIGDQFITIYEDFYRGSLQKNDYKRSADVMKKALEDNLSENEVSKLEALRNKFASRKFGKVLMESQLLWNSLSVEELAGKLGTGNTREHFHTQHKSKRFSDLGESMERHAANALKSNDKDEFFDEITEMFIEYENFKTIVERPDQSMDVVCSDNDKLRPQFREKLMKTYGSSWDTELKLRLWEHFGDDELNRIKTGAGILHELPDAIKNNPREFQGKEREWYSRDNVQVVPAGAALDGSDEERAEKGKEADATLYKVLICNDKNAVYGLITDHLLQYRELERFNVGGTHEERVDQERLQFHKEEDRPKILNQVKKELEDKTLYEIKEFVYSNYREFGQKIHRDLKLPYFLETRKFLYPDADESQEDSMAESDDRPTWETIREQAENQKNQQASDDEIDKEDDKDKEKEKEKEDDTKNELESEEEAEEVETEEEKQARLKKETTDRRIQRIEQQRGFAFSLANKGKLFDINDRFDHLKQAVSSDDPDVIIENLAYALASEFNAGLKKTDSINNLGQDNFDDGVKIFKNVLREKYTDEQITSDQFIDNIVNASRLKLFGSDVDQYKTELAKLQKEKLKDILVRAGITPENKYSMMKLSIFDAKPRALSKKTDIVATRGKVQDIKNLRTYPGFGLTTSGKTKGGFKNTKTLSENIEEFIKPFEDLNNVSISAMFNAMAENHMVVDADDGLPEHARFITMGPKGPTLTATVEELKKGLSQDSTVYKENGFSSLETMQSALEAYDKVISREAMAPGIIEKGTQDLLKTDWISKGQNRVLDEMGNLQTYAYEFMAIKGMLKMGNENLTKEKVSEAFPKSPLDIAKDLVSPIFPQVKVEDDEDELEQAENKEVVSEQGQTKEVVSEQGQTKEVVSEQGQNKEAVSEQGQTKEVVSEQAKNEGNTEELKTGVNEKAQPDNMINDDNIVINTNLSAKHDEDVQSEIEVEENTQPELNVGEQHPVQVEETPEQEMANFAKLAKALDKAKTFVNSKEYNNIVTLCSNLGNPKASAKMGPDGRKAFIAATGQAINDYIAHKAKDGIKPNVFNKFVAVEALSKYVSKKLEPYKQETITVSQGQSVEVGLLNLQLEEKRENSSYNAQEYERDIFAGENITTDINSILENNVKGSMKLGTNLLRKVALETGMNYVHYPEKRLELIDITKRFTSSEFVKDQVKGKNLEEIAPEQKNGMQI